MPNKENKQTRRARLAAAKEARKNMFSPDVQVKIVGITNAPDANNAVYGRANLREANTFTGSPFTRKLTTEEMRQTYRAGLPTMKELETTAENNLNAKGLLSKNSANNARTKRASRSNGWRETGKKYVREKTAENRSNAMHHRTTIIAATRNLEEAVKLEQEAERLRFFDDTEGADELILRARELRKEAWYIVANPTQKSLKNAVTAREFAEGIHAKQTWGWLGSCFGGQCSVVEDPPFTTGSVVTSMPSAITRQAGNW
jgi:hypothetical protein